MKARIAGIKKHSLVNGPGVRMTIFFQGCIHHCNGCQNPDTWSADGGVIYDTDDIIRMIKDDRYIDGITLSGGDPLLQPDAAAAIAQASKQLDLSVWCYTGWSYEEIKHDPDLYNKCSRLFRYVDVLVDGRFLQEKKSSDCIYRGSINQRLIDIRKTEKEKCIYEISI